MLKKLTLANFRRHESLTVDFTGGLNAVKAPNEGGKSTMLEAAAYAFFGSKVLRTPLAEAVTWGKAEKDLKVELVVELEGKDYVFSRSKGGAEVTLDGRPFVTGQNEISNFATQLLGADATAANILMFANQGSLRGTLDAGPKATSQVIEQLADFDLFDRLLDAATERLALGAATIFDERLKGLKAQLDMLELPDRPDEAAHVLLVKGVGERLAELDGKLEAAKDVAMEHYAAWKAEYDKRGRRDELERDIAKYRAQQADTEKKRAEELAKDFPPDLEQQIVRYKATIEDEKDYANRVSAYRKFEAYRVPGSCVEQPVEWVTSQIKDATTQISNLRSDLATLRGEVKTLEERIIQSSTCGFCGQDVSQFPEVEHKNDAIRTEIAGKLKAIAEKDCKLSDTKASKEQFEALIALQDKVTPLVRSLAQYVDVDEACTPNRITWKGEPPQIGDAHDSTPLLRRAEAQLKELHARDARVEAYDRVIAETLAKVATLHDEIGDLNLVPVEAFEVLEQTYLDASAKVQGQEAEIARIKEELEAHNTNYEQRKSAWERASETLARLTGEIAQTERNIEELAFNNALVKKIRGARPTVATKMWNLVLASVSTLFTQMRGTKSVVTKENGGFLVNGQAVESLSGSTLDILGLAVRVALIKTFLPGCPFIVLDEPAQGCDTSRTESLLGFIASCGFSQTILVTHDGLSESFAQNLIEL